MTPAAGDRTPTGAGNSSTERRYDFVVIGAGAAGCVLAARLASQDRSVLLLEAGPDGAPTGAGAASFFLPLADAERTYADQTAQFTAGSGARRYLLGRGRGGGTAVNAMIATPGLAGDYDRWEDELGCTGWGWTSIRSTLDKLAPTISLVPEVEWGTIDRALVAGAAGLGHPSCPDYMADGALGAGPAWLGRRGGRRLSAADAYLPLAGEALTARFGTTVKSVVVDERRALGVLTGDGGFIAAGEVIVCAGAIHSPAMLLRSGVTRAGIGRGLKDHPSARLGLRLREPGQGTGLAAATLLRWSSGIGEADLQLLPLNHLGAGGDPNGASAGLVAAAMSVHSTGTVALAGRSDACRPIVRLNLLGDRRDRRRLREAAREMFALARSEAVREIAREVFIDGDGTTLDDSANRLANDDSLLDRWLVANVGDTFHAACTCRMGPAGDDTAVVDVAGRVHGYRNLRVCDSSIFPDLPRANPYLPTMIVAERIAAMIIEGW